MTRKRLIAGNWKMNKTTTDAVALVGDLVSSIGKQNDVDVVVCPPFTALESAGKVLEGSTVKLGAQNMHDKANGAFTGEVSAAMLKEAGCALTLIGHSERRQYFGETDETVNKKVKAALAAGLRPIVCVGESLAERESGQTAAVVSRQLDALMVQGTGALGASVLAYEPVWAIGTGNSPPARKLAACSGRAAAVAARSAASSSVAKRWSKAMIDTNCLKLAGDGSA